MSNIIPFQYHQKQVRVIQDDNDEPWFVAKDVCNVLDISWRGQETLTRIKSKWKRCSEIPNTSGTSQKTIIIKEPALYKLAFRSNKQEAEDFTDWLAEDVLPQIRKTGSYGQPQQEPRPYVTFTYTQDEAMEDLRKENRRLHRRIVRLERSIDRRDELIDLYKGGIDHLQTEPKRSQLY